MTKKPYIPPNTCPHIDRVIELVDSLSDIKDKNLYDRQLHNINSELEYIRTSNELLRTASFHWYNKHKVRKQRKKDKQSSEE